MDPILHVATGHSHYQLCSTPYMAIVQQVLNLWLCCSKYDILCWTSKFCYLLSNAMHAVEVHSTLFDDHCNASKTLVGFTTMPASLKTPFIDGVLNDISDMLPATNTSNMQLATGTASNQQTQAA